MEQLIGSLLNAKPAPKSHTGRNVVLAIVLLAGAIGVGTHFVLRALNAG
jgi:hypothetical protein